MHCYCHYFITLKYLITGLLVVCLWWFNFSVYDLKPAWSKAEKTGTNSVFLPRVDIADAMKTASTQSARLSWYSTQVGKKQKKQNTN